jgi:hypothetical protein
MKLKKPSIVAVNWVSYCLSFFLSASTAATYIFTAPNSTTTIISLDPCALNVEYQYFILRFIKISLLYGYHWKRGQGVKEAQRQGEVRVTLRITLLTNGFFPLQNDKYLISIFFIFLMVLLPAGVPWEKNEKK